MIIDCGKCLHIWMMRKSITNRELDERLDKWLGYTAQKLHCKTMLLDNVGDICDALGITIGDFFSVMDEVN